MDGAQIIIEDWHQEKPGEATDEGKALAAVETPGVRVSWRKAEVSIMSQDQNP